MMHILNPLAPTIAAIAGDVVAYAEVEHGHTMPGLSFSVRTRLTEMLWRRVRTAMSNALNGEGLSKVGSVRQTSKTKTGSVSCTLTGTGTFAEWTLGVCKAAAKLEKDFGVSVTLSASNVAILTDYLVPEANRLVAEAVAEMKAKQSVAVAE